MFFRRRNLFSVRIDFQYFCVMKISLCFQKISNHEENRGGITGKFQEKITLGRAGHCGLDSRNFGKWCPLDTRTRFCLLRYNQYYRLNKMQCGIFANQVFLGRFQQKSRPVKNYLCRILTKLPEYLTYIISSTYSESWQKFFK